MVCASTVSAPNPLQGQKARSSENFSTELCDGNQLKWECPQGIVFNVSEDIRRGIDKSVFREVTNGTKTPMHKSRNLYISKPSHATENFLVSVEGISTD